MQINGLQQAHASSSISRATPAQSTRPVESASAVGSAAADQLDLSAEAQSISQSQAASVSETSGIRTEKVAALREAIASGTYETPENLSAALDKLLDTFA